MAVLQVSAVARRALLPLAVFIVVFIYRFNTLGGALGGFDNDHFLGLIRANHLLAGEWPLRDYADASLQGAWPPLTYVASAGAQLVFGQSLLAEGLLTTAAVGVGAALTVVAGRALGMSSLLALGAALFSVMPSLKLYGYARPVLFSASAVVLFRYLQKPTIGRMTALAALTAVSFLVRHDYAGYIGVGATMAIAVRYRGRLLEGTRWLFAYGALTFAFLAPTIVIVHQLVGLETYLRSTRALIVDERLRTNLRWPQFHLASLRAEENALAWLYYVFLILPFVAAFVAVWRARKQTEETETAKILGVAVSAALANHFLLRGNLEGRLADPAVWHALLGAWLVAVLWRDRDGMRWRGVGRVTVAVIVTAVAVVSTVAVATVGSVEQELGTAGFKVGVLGAVRTTARVAGLLRDLPPNDWEPPPAGGVMLAAEYLNICTSPDDRVINATYGAESLVFARRLFGAGQVNFVRGFYASDAEQRQAVVRARAQSAPVAFMEPQPLSDSFASDFPIFGAFLREEYVDVGVIPDGDRTYVRVLARRDRPQVGTFRHTGLPCFR